MGNEVREPQNRVNHVCVFIVCVWASMDMYVTFKCADNEQQQQQQHQRTTKKM